MSKEQITQAGRAYYTHLLEEEYAIEGDYCSGLDLLKQNQGNWVVLRTFSKAWGLAGLRVGFGVCSSEELRSALDLTRTPFNTNSVAQGAALRAIRNEGHMTKFVKQIIKAREGVSKELTSRGYKVAPSLGNFLFFETSDPSTEIAERLLRKGTIVKPWKQRGFENFIRVSIGTDAENTKFLADLKDC